MELQTIRAKPAFSSLPLLLAGDLNVHVRDICNKNAELERPVDRDIAELIVGQAGLKLILLNPPDTPTHDSGSAIDLVYASRRFMPTVEVLPRDTSPLVSDHRILLITELGSAPHQQQEQYGKTKWVPFSDA